MNDDKKVIFMVKINRLHFVEKIFLDEIYDLAMEVVPIVPSGENVTVEMICGPEYWEHLSRYTRSLAGMCMSHLVKNRKVPYCYSGKPCQSPRLYQSLKGA